MSFPRYPAYKDSGVEWLGEVPEHWVVKRLRNVSTLNPSKSEISNLDRDTEVSFLPMEAVGDDGTLVLDRTRPIIEVDSGYTYFRDGDVTIAKITPCFENGKGAVMRGLQNGHGFGTTELIVVRPAEGKTCSNFLHCLFTSHPFRQLGEAAMYGAGGQKRVPDDFVRDFAVAIPPLAEQSAITSFLDHETAKIDALVAEQERLIELLKEKRQAVISHAVTKGLDPSVPMKDSGVKWLGEVPAHWETTRLKHATELIVDCPHETPSYSDDGDYLVIRTADIFDGVLCEDGLYRVSETEYFKRVRRQSLLQSDVVYGREGERWGHAALVPRSDTFCLGQRMMQFRVAQHFDPEYMMWLLNSEVVYRQGQQDTVGATSPHVNVGTIRNYALCSPPLEEQQRIGMHLSAKAREFDALIEDAAVAVDLLTERRTALISAAVTGQIDVRGTQS